MLLEQKKRFNFKILVNDKKNQNIVGSKYLKL
jgi:hypothetical protein